MVNSRAILNIEKPRYLGNSTTDRRKIWHDMFAKFGMLRDPVLSTTALSNCNRKLICDVNGHHLENFNDVIITPHGPIHMKFGVPMQNEMPMTVGMLKSGNRRFPDKTFPGQFV